MYSFISASWKLPSLLWRVFLLKFLHFAWGQSYGISCFFIYGRGGYWNVVQCPKQDSKSFDTALLLYDVSMFALQAVNRTHRLLGWNDLFKDFAIYILVYLRSNGNRLYLKVIFSLLKRLKEDYKNLWSWWPGDFYRSLPLLICHLGLWWSQTYRCF